MSHSNSTSDPGDDLSTDPQVLAQRSRESGFNWSAFFWFTGTVLILVLSATMTVGDGRDVYFPGFDRPVPETCTLRGRFGISCPGCGLTRSFIHLAHGRLYEALEVNWVGVVVFAFALLQIPLSLVHWFLPPRERDLLPGYQIVIRWNEWLTVALAILLVFRWILVFVSGSMN